jgi:hypothetical protein
VADELKITGARFVATIAIELNRVACAFTSCAAVLATGLRWTATTRVLADILAFIVCHRILLKTCWFFGVPKSSTSNYLPSNLSGNTSVVL